MFDDPDKKLRWMEQELRAAEAPEQELYDEDFLGEFDSELLEELELTEDDLTPGYNYAQDFGRMIYADEEPVEEEEYEAPPKKKGAGGLVFVALLEVLGILVILGWWKQWLM